METVVLTIHLLLAFALIVVVLLQRSEGGGLGIGGGGGGGMMTGRAAATALSKLTWGLGIGFVITSLALTVIAAREDGAASVLDRIGAPVATPTSPDPPPALGDDLLPPAPAPSTAPAVDAPATPPATE